MAPVRLIGSAALVALVLLAGCLDAGDVAPSSAGAHEEGPALSSVVVAVIDTGINPYHVDFRGGPGFEAVEGFPADALPMGLSFEAATYDEAVERDGASWSAVGPGTLVRFPGTRLAGISLAKDPKSPQLLAPEVPPSRYHLLDDDGHGTFVASAVLAASPHALVVMVQVDDDPRIADAMRWIAQQPWIDLVSVSSATWVEEYAQGEARMGLPAAYAEAHGAGKLIFNGAGNEPVPHMSGEHSGPSFVVAVGGAQSESRGETRLAARFPDVVSDFVQTRALAHSLDEREEVLGTSLSCPYAAGAAAEALWLARSAGASPTAAELRDAMQRAAAVWTAPEWAPGSDPRELILSSPVLLPAAQVGWGYFGPEQAPAAAAILLGEPAPARSPADVAFMQAREAARRALWGA